MTTMQLTLNFWHVPMVPTRAHRDEYKTCSNCSAEVDPADFNDEHELCDECYHEEFISCESCGDETHIDDSRSSDDGDCFCDSCYDDKFTSCDGCSCEINRNQCLTSSGGGDYCDSCYCERFTTCDECDCEIDIHNDDYRSTDYGIFCCDCRAGREEWDQDMDWSGRNVCDKMGTLRKFGVELETDRCDDYEDWASGTAWGAKEDGSISGKEFVSPPLWGDDGYDSVMDFCRRMESNGCEVDDRCGFHLHIDLSDCDAGQRKAIALAYHYTRNVWASFVDDDRKDTYYAQYSIRKDGTVHWDRDTIMRGEGHPYCGERYVWLNWSSYSQHNTVEVRSHEATCDGRAVINWAKAHTKFVDYVRGLTCGQITRIFGSEQDATIMRELKHIWDDADLHDYYTRKSGIGREACIA